MSEQFPTFSTKSDTAQAQLVNFFNQRLAVSSEAWTDEHRYQVIVIMFSGSVEQSKKFFHHVLGSWRHKKLRRFMKKFMLDTLAKESHDDEASNAVESHDVLFEQQCAAEKALLQVLGEPDVDNEEKKQSSLAECIIDSALYAELGGQHLARLGMLNVEVARHILMTDTGVWTWIYNFFCRLFGYHQHQHPSARLSEEDVLRIQIAQVAHDDIIATVTSDLAGFLSAIEAEWDNPKTSEVGALRAQEAYESLVFRAIDIFDLPDIKCVCQAVSDLDSGRAKIDSSYSCFENRIRRRLLSKIRDKVHKIRNSNDDNKACVRQLISIFNEEEKFLEKWIFYTGKSGFRISADELCDFIASVKDDIFHDVLANRDFFKNILSSASYEKLQAAKEATKENGALYKRLHEILEERDGLVEKHDTACKRLNYIVEATEKNELLMPQLPPDFFSIDDQGLEDIWLDMLHSESENDKKRLIESIQKLMSSSSSRMLEFWARFPSLWFKPVIQEQYVLLGSEFFECAEENFLFTHQLSEYNVLMKTIKPWLQDGGYGYHFSFEAGVQAFKDQRRARLQIGSLGVPHNVSQLRYNVAFMSLVTEKRKLEENISFLRYGLSNFHQDGLGYSGVSFLAGNHCCQLDTGAPVLGGVHLFLKIDDGSNGVIFQNMRCNKFFCGNGEKRTLTVQRAQSQRARFLLRETVHVVQSAQDPRGLYETMSVEVLIPNLVAFQQYMKYFKFSNEVFKEILASPDFIQAVNGFQAVQQERQAKIQKIIKELQASQGKQSQALTHALRDHGLEGLLEGATLNQLETLKGWKLVKQVSKVSTQGCDGEDREGLEEQLLKVFCAAVEEEFQLASDLRKDLNCILVSLAEFNAQPTELAEYIEFHGVDMLLSVASEEEEAYILTALSEDYATELKGSDRLVRHRNGGKGWCPNSEGVDTLSHHASPLGNAEKESVINDVEVTINTYLLNVSELD